LSPRRLLTRAALSTRFGHQRQYRCAEHNVPVPNTCSAQGARVIPGQGVGPGMLLMSPIHTMSIAADLTTGSVGLCYSEILKSVIS